MAKLTKEQALAAGGKVWAKDGVEVRVYLNKEAVIALADGFQVSEFEVKSAAKAKTYFDIKTGELRSDVGTVRVLLNRVGINCGK